MTPDELRKRTTLTVNEAAEVLGIATGASAYRAANAGVFPGAFKAQGKWIVPAPPLLRLILAENEETTSAA